MNRAKTFGDFLIAKRMEREMSARQLAIKLDYHHRKGSQSFWQELS